ncbi:unnamed protein product [Merluccius merluccius]
MASSDAKWVIHHVLRCDTQPSIQLQHPLPQVHKVLQLIQLLRSLRITVGDLFQDGDLRMFSPYTSLHSSQPANQERDWQVCIQT